jgi:aryl-alcohol dehydrogenase-like predicted oxidoreductase
MTRARLYAGLPVSDLGHESVLSDANFDILERLQLFAAEHSHSIGELAIVWLLSHSWVSAVITGASSPEQISANIAAASWKLTEEEMTQIDGLVSN